MTETEFAIRAFSAMSQETRMGIFKALMSAGTEGMTPSDLTDKLGVRQNTISTNLSVLLIAGLVCRTRAGRSVRYFIALDGIKRLMEYLLDECCGNSKDLYQPILNISFKV